MKIYRDILSSTNDGEVTTLTCSTFLLPTAPINHLILLSRLVDWFGITGKATDWLESYLTVRCQSIKLGDFLSSTFELPFGVPQGC